MDDIIYSGAQVEYMVKKCREDSLDNQGRHLQIVARSFREDVLVSSFAVLRYQGIRYLCIQAPPQRLWPSHRTLHIDVDENGRNDVMLMENLESMVKYFNSKTCLNLEIGPPPRPVQHLFINTHTMALVTMTSSILSNV